MEGLPTVIAIDGPVAAGKTSVGALVARRLGYRFLDTGTMYRAVTWAALQRKVDLEDEQALGRLAEGLRLELPGEAAEQAVIEVDGRPLGPELRRSEVEAAVSIVSRYPRVRQALVARQREIARTGRIVMVGRDIGTVVLPEAPLKIYLDATPQERARRRQRELAQQGQAADEGTILRELLRRDELDSQRAVSPLRPAADARIMETQDLTLEEVVQDVLELVRKAGV